MRKTSNIKPIISLAAVFTLAVAVGIWVGRSSVSEKEEASVEHPTIALIQSKLGELLVHIKQGYVDETDLQALSEKHRVIGDVRGKGVMLALEMESDRDSKTPDRDTTAAVFEACRDAGLILSKSGPYQSTLRMVPPLCLSMEDVDQVADGMGMDARIGRAFLNTGPGWGGSCFPKDVSALVHTADDYGYEAALLKATINVNTRQRLLTVEKLQQVLKILKGKTVGLLGLTFKPDTDDMRDAPSLIMIESLNRLGA